MNSICGLRVTGEDECVSLVRYMKRLLSERFWCVHVNTLCSRDRDEPDDPPLETKVRCSGGWFTGLKYRIKLALGGSDEELMLENRTQLSWRVYHDYHLLGIIDAGEYLIFRLHKHGSLNVRPCAEQEKVEYLMLHLSVQIRRVYIYRRRLNSEIEVYDMRVA